jgi:chromate transporter
MTSTPDTPRPFSGERPAGIFWRFLRFGALAWGGPVAQIAMIRHELVDEERWITSERFNRVLAVYQALPGPEAHELCVYFGMVAGGRLGGLLAGLGFMLPGFVLMFALSWGYVTFGIGSAFFTAIFLGCKPAVVAVIWRAVHRIGAHALSNRVLMGIAVAVAAATYSGLNFYVTLPLAGVAYAAITRSGQFPGPLLVGVPWFAQLTAHAIPTTLSLFGYGLRSGLLTFGGAYTVISFLQHDAVVRGAWMTNAQFLDGLALSGILPAPLVIFSTFVGYLGGGALGALAMTAGVFAPAFAFTLVGHSLVERLVANTAAHAFLDGITAGVVGLIAITALGLFRDTVTTPIAAGIFVVALLLAYRWKAKAAVVGIMGLAGLAGWLVTRYG